MNVILEQLIYSPNKIENLMSWMSEVVSRMFTMGGQRGTGLWARDKVQKYLKIIKQQNALFVCLTTH